jgi:hypothetical protein
MRLAAVPNESNDHPQSPKLRLVPAPDATPPPTPPPRLRLVPAPRLTQRELVIMSLIRRPDPSEPDRS